MRKSILAVLVTAAALIAMGASAETTPTTTIGHDVLRVDKWMLHESSGAALYQQLCASCHGVRAAGGGRAAGLLSVPPPALDRLREAGVPREHWTYVLRAPCEDGLHWGPDGSETMPCWQRIFRQALGNDAAPTLISQKLVAYLEAIQK